MSCRPFLSKRRRLFQTEPFPGSKAFGPYSDQKAKTVLRADDCAQANLDVSQYRAWQRPLAEEHGSKVAEHCVRTGPMRRQESGFDQTDPKSSKNLLSAAVQIAFNFRDLHSAFGGLRRRVGVQ